MISIFRKKGKQQTVVQIKVDHEELAQEIVKAQEQAQEKKSMEQETGISSMMAGIVTWLFAVLACAGFTSVAFLVLPIAIKCWKKLEWGTIYQNVYNIGYISIMASISVLLLGFSIISVCMAKGVKKEKDKHYVMSILATLIAIIALLVSFFK